MVPQARTAVGQVLLLNREESVWVCKIPSNIITRSDLASQTLTLIATCLQEQLTRLTELRELIVHTREPLQNLNVLRRLPLLVIAYCAHRTLAVRPQA